MSSHFIIQRVLDRIHLPGQRIWRSTEYTTRCDVNRFTDNRKLASRFSSRSEASEEIRRYILRCPEWTVVVGNTVCWWALNGKTSYTSKFSILEIPADEEDQ